MAIGPSYTYRIDAEDHLVEVDTLWLAFARENGAPELTESSLLGRSLWDFLEDRTLRYLYSRIHDRVRKSRKPVVMPYRCDSPSLRRYMQMTLRPGPDDSLLYVSRIQRVVPQRRLAVLDSKIPRTSQSSVQVCSCCKRGRLDGVGWLDLEDLCFRTGLLEKDVLPKIEHVVCPACANVMKRDLESAGVA